MIHLDFIWLVIIKYEVIFNKIKNPIAFCILKEQKKDLHLMLDS